MQKCKISVRFPATIPTTTTGTTNPEGIDPMLSVLGAGAAIGVVVVIVGVYIKKR
ncbi:MAG: hypothetical protein R6V83_00320 [Candidatus Thorarchaeota archaeon]